MIRLSLMIGAICLLCGCHGFRGATPPEDSLSTEAAEKDRDKIKSVEKILDRMMRGLVKADHAMFSKDFTEEMRTAFPEKGFASFAKENYAARYGGVCESRELLGELCVGELVVFLWKARFKDYKNDVLLRLDVGEVDGELKVFRFIVQ